MVFPFRFTKSIGLLEKKGAPIRLLGFFVVVMVTFCKPSLIVAALITLSPPIAPDGTMTLAFVFLEPNLYRD